MDSVCVSGAVVDSRCGLVSVWVGLWVGVCLGWVVGTFYVVVSDASCCQK